MIGIERVESRGMNIQDMIIVELEHVLNTESIAFIKPVTTGDIWITHLCRCPLPSKNGRVEGSYVAAGSSPLMSVSYSSTLDRLTHSPVNEDLEWHRRQSALVAPMCPFRTREDVRRSASDD